MSQSSLSSVFDTVCILSPKQHHKYQIINIPGDVTNAITSVADSMPNGRLEFETIGITMRTILEVLVSLLFQPDEDYISTNTHCWC